MSQRVRFLLSLVFAVAFLACASPSRVVCGGRVLIDGKRAFEFNANEEPLLCGDSELVGWQNVPLVQTEFHLRSFLKSRGYYTPTFVFKNDHLEVDPGMRYRVQHVEFHGAPPEFHQVGYVGWRGAELVSATLDDIEAWSLRRLKITGYACATVELKAVTETQTVHVYVNAGERQFFPDVQYVEGQSLKTSVMRRYDAFHVGETFDQNLLNLSSGRMEGQGIVTHSRFQVECPKDAPIVLKHVVSPGEPRLLRAGAGITTEEFPIARVSWKNTRLGSNASTLSADLYASPLRQEFKFGFEWHAFENASRWFYRPAIELSHLDEQDQEVLKFEISNTIGTSLDFRRFTLDAEVGPQTAYEKSIEGPTVGEKEYVTWETIWRLRSHDEQVYASDPRQGFQISLETSSLVLTTDGETNIHHVNLAGSQIFNLGRFDPPQYVLGYRFGIQSVLGSDARDVTENLPADYFTWLGGEQDVRGFGRRELPLDSSGALSSAYIGLEFRAPAWLPRGWDPLLFTDLGWLGSSRLELDSTLYWSPGLGLRWASPIGAARFTAAHGFITRGTATDRDSEHLQFFLSLGSEF